MFGIGKENYNSNKKRLDVTMKPRQFAIFKIMIFLKCIITHLNAKMTLCLANCQINLPKNWQVTTLPNHLPTPLIERGWQMAKWLPGFFTLPKLLNLISYKLEMVAFPIGLYSNWCIICLVCL